MAETAPATREPSFAQQLRRVDQSEQKVAEAKAILDFRIQQLREVCPHLVIATAPSGFGGRDIRVCQHCGIQEVSWDTAFKTLTAPGGTWFEASGDKSKQRRNGKAPVIFPMSSDQAYSYRRGPHKDVSNG